MMNFIRELRLIPIAVIACACLLALKAADIFLGGDGLIGRDDTPQIERTTVTRGTPAASRPSSSMASWASQMFNFPDGSGASAPPQSVASRPADRLNPDITGSVPAETADKDKPKDAPKDKPKDARAEPPKGPENKGPENKGPENKAPDNKPAGTVIPTDASQPSGAERAILERLQQRRQELDTRARELDIRESLIKAAEKRIEGQLTELKETESRITAETQQRDDAQAARFKGLVTMYENMKPRDAAKIFDRLDIGVLLEVASKIEPRHMADIMAQMSPDAAQHLTVELASQAQQVKPNASSPNDLPKIQGQPTQ